MLHPRLYITGTARFCTSLALLPAGRPADYSAGRSAGHLSNRTTSQASGQPAEYPVGVSPAAYPPSWNIRQRPCPVCSGELLSRYPSYPSLSLRTSSSRTPSLATHNPISATPLHHVSPFCRLAFPSLIAQVTALQEYAALFNRCIIASHSVFEIEQFAPAHRLVPVDVLAVGAEDTQCQSPKARRTSPRPNSELVYECVGAIDRTEDEWMYQLQVLSCATAAYGPPCTPVWGSRHGSHPPGAMGKGGRGARTTDHRFVPRLCLRVRARTRSPVSSRVTSQETSMASAPEGLAGKLLRTAQRGLARPEAYSRFEADLVRLTAAGADEWIQRVAKFLRTLHSEQLPRGPYCRRMRSVWAPEPAYAPERAGPAPVLEDVTANSPAAAAVEFPAGPSLSGPSLSGLSAFTVTVSDSCIRRSLQTPGQIEVMSRFSRSSSIDEMEFGPVSVGPDG